MEDWPRQLDMTEVSRTLRHTLSTRLALEIPIDSTQPRIHQTTSLRLMSGLIHYFRMLNLRDGVRFLEAQG